MTTKHIPKPKPNAWKTGPDPVVHKKYRAWLQQKTQAAFRKEPWDLPFEQWCDIWKDLWDQRGKDSEQYCMTRCDLDLGWTSDNVQLLTRREHQIQHMQRRAALGQVKGYKQRLKEKQHDPSI